MKGVFEKNNLRISARLIHGISPFPPMYHSHAEIICMLSGSVTVTIDGIKKELGPRDISFSFPYSIHDYESSPLSTALLVMFSPEITGSFERTLLGTKPSYPYIYDNGNIALLLNNVIKHTNSNEKFSEETAVAYLCATIGEILSAMNLVDIENTDISTTQKVLIYCTQNYKNDITLKTASENLFISQNHITRIFTTKLKCTFRNYINLLRISEAKKMLKNTEDNIIEIMYECGFKNQSSFNRIFLDICKMTPTEYRKRCRLK